MLWLIKTNIDDISFDIIRNGHQRSCACWARNLLNRIPEMRIGIVSFRIFNNPKSGYDSHERESPTKCSNAIAGAGERYIAEELSDCSIKERGGKDGNSGKIQRNILLFGKVGDELTGYICSPSSTVIQFFTNG